MKKILKKYCGKKLDGRYLIYSDDKLIERGKYEEGKRERLQNNFPIFFNI